MPKNILFKETNLPHLSKVIRVFIICLAILSLQVNISGCKRKDTVKEVSSEVIIWTYDSFNSEWGPGPDVSKAFEEKTGIKIIWESRGDAGMVLSRLLQEGANADADLILGLDQNMAERALASGLLEAYRPDGVGSIAQELILDAEFYLSPIDYSYFAIVYDSERVSKPPLNLEELTTPQFTKSLILIDPRTSSVGLGFFTWVKEIYGSSWREYWQRLKPSILTIAEGWSSAYGLFTMGEAPLVLSYTTSPGYHLEYEGTDRYKAAIFSEGHLLQIEAAGLLKTAKNKDNASRFLDFMLSEDFQSIIPLTNWMYPVIDISLPPSFAINPKSDKPLKGVPVSEDELNEWAALLTR